MSAITFIEESSQFVTPIPDSFILEHMPSANGVYVKVYLSVFYAYTHRIPNFTFAGVASDLNILESEVLEALRHWNSRGALRLSYNKAADLYRISFSCPENPGPGPGEPAETTRSFAEPAKVIRVEQAPVYSQEEMSLYMKNPEIRDLFHTVSHTLGTQLSQASLSRIFSFYDYYRLPVDVIKYLISYCVEKDKRDLRYMEKVAMNWSDNEIHSLEEAQKYVHRFDTYAPILKALHASSTIPTEEQAAQIDRWISEYGMNTELLTEAAVRTFERTHKAQFSYMKKIVEAWHEQNVTSMEGVLRVDAAFSSKGKDKSQSTGNAYKDNRYIPSNNYDYDEILARHRQRLSDQYEQIKEN
ncbi:MAG: DnaD domain protein [Lachnospiraceae bacterium]|nr:DnaD domain protein [Lachnospiraceae bacterium]